MVQFYRQRPSLPGSKHLSHVLDNNHLEKQGDRDQKNQFKNMRVPDKINDLAKLSIFTQLIL